MIRLRHLSVPGSVFLLACSLLLAAAPASAQPELSYAQYRAMSWAADRIDHMTTFEPMAGEPGMFLAVAERFGTILVYRSTAQGIRREWKSAHLGGIPEELLVADLDGDGFDDSLVCRTSAGKIYVWSLENYAQTWESLQGEYERISCFTTANVDQDEAREIILLGDEKIHYVDGTSFAKEFTSIADYSATMMRCGDVDGDGRPEIVLNSGQIVDTGTGEVEWDEEQFFSRIELLDIDGDGTPEIFTENEIGGGLKVFNAGYRSEVRFQ
ncbi:MAG: VCBS repeat-containing protein [bacterium]|nr:VCBS repeat-containing protein [bacterium]